MIKELLYGFVDAENKLVGSAIILENDTETYERVLSEIPNAVAGHVVTLPTEIFELEKTVWNGKRFLPPKPFDSWAWSDEIEYWVAPTPVPFEEGNWIWNEKSLSWVLDEQE